jgi:hypothetical protein
LLAVNVISHAAVKELVLVTQEKKNNYNKTYHLLPRDAIACGVAKCKGDRVSKILVALAASENGENAISFNMSVAGS